MTPEELIHDLRDSHHQTDVETVDLLEELMRERDEARAIAHDRGTGWGETTEELKEVLAQNHRLREELEVAGAAAEAAVNGMEAENRRLREALQEIVNLEAGMDPYETDACRVAQRALEPKP